MESATIVTSTYSGFLALMARKPGFLGLEAHRQNLNQVPVTPGQAVTIELVPEARIVGRVILPSSNASDRIAVRLYQRQVFQGHAYWNYVAAAFARSSGDFRFADLAPGTYKLLTGELMDRDPLTLILAAPPSDIHPSISPMPQIFKVPLQSSCRRARPTRPSFPPCGSRTTT